MSDVKDTLSSIIDLLEPLNTDERMRVIKTALTFLGDSFDSVEANENYDKKSLETDNTASSYRPKVKAWMKQHEITDTILGEVFHLEGDDRCELIGQIPGKSNRERALHVYILRGIAGFIQSGEAKFEDSVARDWCESAGCLDAKNHATNIKDKGNAFTGDKNAGWSLTQPGLKRAADLIKLIGSDE